MKIAIDTTPLNDSKAGIGYYTHSLIHSLIIEDKEDEFYLLTNNKSFLGDIEFSDRVKIIEFGGKAGFGWIRKVSSWARKNSIDVLISTSNLSFSIFFPKTLQIVHDITPITHSQFFGIKSSLKFRFLLHFAIKRASKIATISQTSRNEISRLYPKFKDKILNLGIGLNNWANTSASKEIEEKTIEKFKLPNKFFLSVGTLEPRKNHVNMIRAFAEFSQNNPEYKYVITGKKGWMFKEIFQTVELLGLQDKVIFTGYVSEDELNAIYNLCTCLLIMSHFEGFGLPIIEAYSRKKPVVLSDISIFREIDNPNSFYANPNAVGEIFTAMKKAVDAASKLKYPENFLSRFTWKKVANSFIELIHSKRND